MTNSVFIKGWHLDNSKYFVFIKDTLSPYTPLNEIKSLDSSVIQNFKFRNSLWSLTLHTKIYMWVREESKLWWYLSKFFVGQYMMGTVMDI